MSDPPLVHIAPPPRPNPYLEPLRAKHRAWQQRGIADYVFVFDDHPQITTFDRMRLRVVVQQGRVVSASSMEYGGSLSEFDGIPTMEVLFDRAEEIATFGEGGVPVRFSIEYDAALGYPRSLDADGRDSIADDESSLQVLCFATDLDGCRPVPISKRQCRGAGGWLSPTGGQGCDPQGWSIGLVSERELCCRSYSTPSYDDITAAQCKAAGGRDHDCGDADLAVGGSQTRSAGCCRTFVR